MRPAYQLVRLANGSVTIRSNADHETFHPVAGPDIESEALYVRQLRLRSRIKVCQGPFVVWDVGLGAASNPLAALRALEQLQATIRILSFDRTTEALEFAFEKREEINYLRGFEQPVRTLLEEGTVLFRRGRLTVEWQLFRGDFPTMLAASVMALRSSDRQTIPSPHAIFFDAFSPARNPEMWTLQLWSNLFAITEPESRPCSVATFTRSTMARVTMLLAGFNVGRGATIAGKEETTVAATDLALIDEPFDESWLEKARRSHSAEPLHSPEYRQASLTAESLIALANHPQIRGTGIGAVDIHKLKGT